ncbi:hypothetical protein ElyMa_004686300 [Elysia marginata]|uniref:Uncharacterized protein n=1 Tax=Elysia marginata TaxID=1093978 RepID=A0AAV4I6U3_9GAST|nr:hypothetical protein ElyMa_004686300 [Elysia marginata]
MKESPENKPIFTIDLSGDDTNNAHDASSLRKKSILKSSLKSAKSDSSTYNGSLMNGNPRASVKRQITKQVSINESLFDAAELELPGNGIKRSVNKTSGPVN